MQKIQISKKIYFISLIALVFVLGLSGCGKALPEDDVGDDGKAGENVIEGEDALGGEGDNDEILDEEDEVGGNTIESFWDSEFFTDYAFNRKGMIQEFLESQDGILKSYSEEYRSIHSEQVYIKTGARIIENTSQQYTYDLNSRVLMSIMELKWHLITDKEVSIEQVKRDIFEILQKEDKDYQEMAVYEDDTLIIYLTSFGYILDEFFKNYPEENEIVFKDGRKVQVEEDMPAGEFAVKRVLGLLAEDYDEWEKWSGDGSESFYQIYQKFFGENSLDSKEKDS